MKPFVSILIPAFSPEEFIADSLASAIGQTWPRTEIIVVDDGSTDATRRIATRFESPRVQVVSQAHLGAAAARNHALSLCQGDFIQWLDADDLLAADKVERQMMRVPQLATGRTLLSGS